MTTREKAHKLLDELPESEVEPVLEFIVSRHADPLLQAIANAPEDDEPWTDEDEAAVQESRDEIAAGVPLIPLEDVKRKYDLA
jgi:hypothetical protein